MEKVICASCGFDSEGYSIFEKECPNCGEKNVCLPHNEIINLTPHDVHYVEQNDRCENLIRETFKSRGVARCEVKSECAGVFYDGYAYDGRYCTPPIRRVVFGAVSGLPEPLPGVLFIVSRLVKQAVPDRNDCVVPDDIIRDKDGNIIGCTGFAL